MDSDNYERIWLENPNQQFGHDGRQWCQDKVWPEFDGDLEPVEYIRADIHAARIEADARRIAELEEANERLRLAVQQAGNAFYNYAQSHAAKGTPEADEKAKRNRDLCAIMDAALGGGHE